jgi:hypothetical protein
MKLVVVTGAGASRDLSATDTPLPLMETWAERLRERIGSQLSAMSRLDEARDGVEFERTLGALLRWEATLDSFERFAGMTRPNPGAGDDWPQRMNTALTHARGNMDTFTTHLHESLFAEFGPDRLSTQACAGAYGALFDQLTGPEDEQPESIIFATTNYDRSIEMALESLAAGWDRPQPLPRTGCQPHGYLSSQLDPAGLGTFRADNPSVIYLHGAVGWYTRDDGSIVATAADPGYNPTLGLPTILYPDPEKEIERMETRDLWDEFKKSLRNATHVLVIGHSLNDPHLLDQLKSAKGRIGYVARTERRKSVEPDKLKRIQKLLPKAIVIPGSFGPEPWFGNKPWAEWTQGELG